MKLITFSFFNAIITITPNCFIVATKEERKYRQYYYKKGFYCVSIIKLIQLEVNFNVLNINVSECKDTGNGAKDYENNGCDWYTIDPRITDPNWLYHNNASCGRYDDDDFKAHKMCCACKDSSKYFLRYLLRYTG